MSPCRFPLLALVLSFVSMAASVSAAAPAQDELIWRGDQATGRSIMDDLAKQYAKEKRGKITLQPFSTLSGLDAVAAGTADIAGSARGKYARRAEEANIEFVPVALDAAAMITHPKNPASNLTLKQIFDVYYGRITNWKELGGNDLPINLYAIAAPLDGVEFSLRELVFRNGDQRVAAPRLYLNTTKLEEAIALDPAGLGLSTLAGVNANKGIKMLTVEGVAPSVNNVTDASYPLYITLFLANRADSPKRDAIDRFSAFLATPPAKDILRRHQLVPYAEGAVAVGKNNERMAFIDAHVGRDAAGTAAANLAGGALVAATPTPVSAPRAVLESKNRIAPTAESTDAARANLARAEEKKAAEKAAAAAKPKAVASTAAPKSAVPAAAAEPKPAVKKPTAPAKAVSKAAPKPVAKKPKAVAKADAPAKPAAPAPATFGNVNSGANGN